MKPLAQFVLNRIVAHPLHLGSRRHVGWYPLKRSPYVRGCDGVRRKQRGCIGTQRLPGLFINCAGRVQIVLFLISVNRNAKIIAVAAINLARREPGAVEEDLDPHDARSTCSRTYLRRVRGVLDFLCHGPLCDGNRGLLEHDEGRSWSKWTSRREG